MEQIQRKINNNQWICVRKSIQRTSLLKDVIRSLWWGFVPVITDWTVICTVNWSWHPRQLAPVVEKSRPWSMFYKDAPFTKPQEKTCGLSAPPWRPNSTAAGRSWRRRRHSSPERPWSCRLRTPRRRRRKDVILNAITRLKLRTPACFIRKTKQNRKQTHKQTKNDHTSW